MRLGVSSAPLVAAPARVVMFVTKDPSPSFSVHAECRTGDVVSGKTLTVGNHMSRREHAACVYETHSRSGLYTCCDLLDQRMNGDNDRVRLQYNTPAPPL